MEYVVGPLLTMLISLGYTQMRHKDCKAKQLLIEEKIENVEKEILNPLDNEDQKRLRKLLNKINLIKQ